MPSHRRPLPVAALLVPFVIAFVFAGPGAGAADPIAGAPFLRTRAPWIASVLAEAPALAPTLQRLVDRLAMARVIVYIDELDNPTVAWDGRVRYVGTAPGVRYLRIELRRLTPARTAAVVAHELQHVVEVVEGDIRSAGEFDRLFHRIGFVVPGTPGHVDTLAAIRAGVQTLRELTGVPPNTAYWPQGRR